MKYFEKHIGEIEALCRKYKVHRLYVFGSVLSGQFSETSDIDLLVLFDNVDLTTYADNYYGLKFELESLFQRNVDLLEQQAIRNPYLQASISSHQRLLYAA